MSGWFSSTFASALDSVYNAIDPDFAKYEGSQDGKGGDKQQQQEATRGVEEEGKVEEDNNQPPQPSSAINTATPSTATTIGTSNATIIATRQDDTSDTHRVVVAGVSELAESGLKLIDKTFDFASNFLGNSLVTGYKEANKVASGDLTTIHSIQKSATDAAMPVLTRATDVALPVMNRVYTDAAIPALSKGLDALETLGTIGAKGVSSLLDGAGAGAGAAGAVVLNSSSVSSISVHPQNTPVLVDPHSEDPLSDATSRSPLNAAISSSPKTTPLPKLTLFLENNAGNANFQALEMMSSETQLQSPSSNTIPPPSATISAAMDDINETLDPDAVLEGVEVLDSDEIFAQGVLVESCVAGLDAELVVHHLQQTSSSGASNQRFVDQMRDLCEKYEVELDLVYKEHDSATKPLPILVYTLYLHFLADFTAKFGEWMRLTSQAILITNTSSSSSSSATRLAECIRQAAIHTLGRLNEIHETTKLGVSGITSDDDVVLVDTVTTQMDLDVEACVAQVQDILGMVAKVLTASLLKQGGNNTKICDNESVTNAAAAAFSPSKSPSTAAPSTSTTSLTDDSSLHQKKSSLVSPITTDSVAIPVESSLDSRVGGEGEGDGEEEGETTPTAATSAQSQLAVTATVAAAVKPNKKLE